MEYAEVESQSTTAAQNACREHLMALDTIRFAKNFLVFIACMMPLAHVGAWSLMEFFWVTDASDAVATAPAHDVQMTASSDQYDNAIRAALPLTEFMGRCAIMLLAVTMLLGVLVCVSGRMGGVSYFIKALYLTVIVGAMFIPWERVTPEHTHIYGVFTTMDVLKAHHEFTIDTDPAAKASLWGVEMPAQTHSMIVNGSRFGLMPLIAVLVLMVAGFQSGRGLSAARRTGGGDIPMKVV
jgi:hypothetical protein